MDPTEIESDVAKAGDAANAVTIRNLYQSLESARPALDDGTPDAAHVDFILRVTRARYPALGLFQPPPVADLDTAAEPRVVGMSELGDHIASIDRFTKRKRDQHIDPSSANAYAFALGSVTYLLADMYRRHGVPDSIRDEITERDQGGDS